MARVRNKDTETENKELASLSWGGGLAAFVDAPRLERVNGRRAESRAN